MPLDATGSIIILEDDALTRIGVTPVPYALVQRYKAEYKARWMRLPSNRVLRGPFEWRTIYFVVWRAEEGFRRYGKSDLTKTLKTITLTDFLAAPTKFNMRSSDRTPPPKELVDLATMVEKNLPDAQFSVEYFDTDPVLNVHYGETYACLGIWDKGEIIAIADHNPITSTRPKGFLARLRQTLFMGGLWG